MSPFFLFFLSVMSVVCDCPLPCDSTVPHVTHICVKFACWMQNQQHLTVFNYLEDECSFVLPVKCAVYYLLIFHVGGAGRCVCVDRTTAYMERSFPPVWTV